MKNDVLKIAFKKLLGNGRAFKTPKRFMSDFLDLLVSPFEELKERFINLKYTHFPTKNVDKNDIVNGEELFGIIDSEKRTLEQRAAEVEGHWSSFGGCHTFQQIEKFLKNRGFDVRVLENIPNEKFDMYGAREVGNGFLLYENGHKDPIAIKDGKHSFIVKFENFFTSEQIQELIETLVKNKPAHNGVFVVPRYLRKKEIHHVLTKSQMQKYKKSHYCDCRTKEGF